ncbi:MAG: hypothetical protein RQ971_06230 [Armatimonadota bacterium]|nr:hypothetical protein [Armatimonadota bacterium]
MAKPIPFNRRWLQNQQARAEAAADPAAATPPVAREQAQRLQAIICAALDVPEPDDEAFDAMELVRAYLQELPREADAVLYARFESLCPGCGEPIRVGDPIVRHPQWGRYVHQGCRNRQQRAAVTIVARYPGICRHCGQPVHPGERITQVPRLGWVHEPCAQQRQRNS